MDIPFSVIGLAVLLAWLIYRYVVYPSFVSPLAKLPSAHPLCAFSRTWFQRQRDQMRELKTLYAAHERCGPVVRLGPDEVSVVSEDGLKQVYVAGLDKAVWYQQTFYNYGVQNLVSTLDHKTHSTVRRMIAPLYTKSYLQRSPDMDQLSKRIIFDRLLPTLEDYGQQKQEADVMKLFEWTGVDFITAYIWGTANSTNFLEDKVSRERYFGEWDKARGSPDLQDKPITDNLYMEMSKAAIAFSKEKKTGVGSWPLVIAKMYEEMSSKSKEWHMSETEIVTRCASEMVDHVIATQETNTITWTYILYRLSQHPELQDKLRRELHTLHPGFNSDSKTLPSPANIDNLPLLNAIVIETLRLHAANPARMQRVVPAGGLRLHGYYIPSGTTISTNAYCLHRNKEAFPDAFEWVPQRWLSPNGDGTERGHGVGTDAMRRWFWAFGSGPRMCIGQNFAIQGRPADPPSSNEFANEGQSSSLSSQPFTRNTPPASWTTKASSSLTRTIQGQSATNSSCSSTLWWTQRLQPPS